MKRARSVDDAPLDVTRPGTLEPAGESAQRNDCSGPLQAPLHVPQPCFHGAEEQLGGSSLELPNSTPPAAVEALLFMHAQPPSPPPLPSHFPTSSPCTVAPAPHAAALLELASETVGKNDGLGQRLVSVVGPLPTASQASLVVCTSVGVQDQAGGLGLEYSFESCPLTVDTYAHTVPSGQSVKQELARQHLLPQSQWAPHATRLGLGPPNASPNASAGPASSAPFAQPYPGMVYHPSQAPLYPPHPQSAFPASLYPQLYAQQHMYATAPGHPPLSYAHLPPPYTYQGAPSSGGPPVPNVATTAPAVPKFNTPVSHTGTFTLTPPSSAVFAAAVSSTAYTMGYALAPPAFPSYAHPSAHPFPFGTDAGGAAGFPYNSPGPMPMYLGATVPAPTAAQQQQQQHQLLQLQQQQQQLLQLHHQQQQHSQPHAPQAPQSLFAYPMTFPQQPAASARLSTGPPLAAPPYVVAAQSQPHPRATDRATPPAAPPAPQRTKLEDSDESSSSGSLYSFPRSPRAGTGAGAGAGGKRTRHFCKFPGCTSSFSQRYNLTRHALIHTGEKPFVCTFAPCTAAFNQRNSLQYHLSTHTHSRGFACEFPDCGSAFASRSALTVHTRIHTGESPYYCEEAGCGLAFSTKHKLVRHAHRHEIAASQ